MSASLVGADDLRARLKAIRQNVFKPMARDWADEATRIGRDKVNAMNMPYSGYGEKRSKPQARLLPSIRRKTATMRKAVVVGSYHAYFVDAGVKPHSLKARPSTVNRAARQGRTIFSRAGRKHPGYAARPFRGATAVEAYRKHPAGEAVVKAWNEAA